jgi:hypothetical protein
MEESVRRRLQFQANRPFPERARPKSRIVRPEFAEKDKFFESISGWFCRRLTRCCEAHPARDYLAATAVARATRAHLLEVEAAPSHGSSLDKLGMTKLTMTEQQSRRPEPVEGRPSRFHLKQPCD